MNDIQMLTICGMLLGIFAASWFNNSRMGDLSARIGDTKEVLRAEMKALEVKMDLQAEKTNHKFNAQFEKTNNKIDEFLKIIAGHDQRIAKLETERR
jgi:hypothetical protein